MKGIIIYVFIFLVGVCCAQRGSYAGSGVISHRMQDSEPQRSNFVENRFQPVPVPQPQNIPFNPNFQGFGNAQSFGFNGVFSGR